MSARQRAVVIGAGITGTLTALELQSAGFDVEILEAAHVGAGSSCRTAAGIRQQFSTPGTIQGMRFAVRAYLDLARDLPGGEQAIVQSGYLFLYGDDDAWAAALRRVGVQHEAGLVEVEALEPGALAERFPWVDPEAVRGGTYCPTDGFLRPEVIYGEAARRAVALGARLHQRAPVTGARRAGGRLEALITPKGTHEADLFIDCTNAWSPRLAELLGAEVLPVAPLKRYLWFVKRDGSMRPETLAAMPLTIAPGGAYCRPENAESLLIGKKHVTPPEPDFTYAAQDEVAPEYDHRGGFDSVPYALWAELAETLPPLGEFAGITATTGGYYGTTPDHNPFLGYDRQLDNLVRLVGFSGHGAMFGPFTARVARHLAEAGRDLDHVDLDGQSVSLAPFQIGRSYDHSEELVI